MFSFIITIMHEILGSAGDNATGVEKRNERRWSSKGGEGRSQWSHDL